MPGSPAWRPVDPTEWCGEGADVNTGRCFSSTVNAVPGTGGAGPGYLATSATSLTIASSGSKAPVTQLNLAYSAGARVRLTSTGSAAWMEGVVTGYAADGTLTFTADLSSGAGSHTDWNINLAGAAGAATTGIASQGTFTLTVGVNSQAIADVAVVANSRILIMPTSVSAALLIARTDVEAAADASGEASSPYISAKTVGVSFTMHASNGGVFAGTESFDYIIVNP